MLILEYYRIDSKIDSYPYVINLIPEWTTVRKIYTHRQNLIILIYAIDNQLI